MEVHRREGWACDAASRRTRSPTHYQLSYSGPTTGLIPLGLWGGQRRRKRNKLLIIIIIAVFLERLSMWNMLSCAEQVQIQKYKTHAYKTPRTACVQTIMLRHPTMQVRWVKTNLHTHKKQKSHQCTYSNPWCVCVCDYVSWKRPLIVLHCWASDHSYTLFLTGEHTHTSTYVHTHAHS